MDPVIEPDRPSDESSGRQSAPAGEYADLQAFLLKLVHDLRSPLNASLMWLDVLRLKEQPAETRKAVDAIRRSIDRQGRLLRELGDAAAYAAGSVELSLRRVEIDALTGQIIAAAKERSGECHITNAALDDALHLDADLDGIARAVGSIVDLFATAAAGGRVEIDIAAPGPQRRLCATFSRNDAAIAAETLHALVQPPWRRPRSAYQVKGLNLGIFIAARLIAAHGGSLSVVDARSTAAVRVELPLAD